MARAASIPELSMVGAKGAVVFEYRDGAGYEVEFDESFHCILTVERDDIRPV